MLTVSGAALIDPQGEIKEFPVSSGKYVLMSCHLIGKDPYKPNGRHYYKCAILVPMEYLEIARGKIQPGKFMQLRIAELKGTKNDKGYIYNDINTKWQWIEILSAVPGRDRKQDI